jgi:transcriptional repressor NrdR
MFDKEVSSKFIGELVMKELRELDQVAYVRFASVYRDFKDVNEFVEEVRPMITSTPSKKAEKQEEP